MAKKVTPANATAALAGVPGDDPVRLLGIEVELAPGIPRGAASTTSSQYPSGWTVSMRVQKSSADPPQAWVHAQHTQVEQLVIGHARWIDGGPR